IAGAPNAGKSSQLNALIGKDRAIVTEVAGTTRDVLTESMVIDGMPLLISDTAGLRVSGDRIERIGVELAQKEIENSDVVLLVWDMGKPLLERDREVLRAGKPVIFVKNKADAGSAPTPDEIPGDIPAIEISALTGDGVEELKRLIASTVRGSDALLDINLTEQRHADAVEEALVYLRGSREAIQAGMPLDIAALDLKNAWSALGTITGVSAPDELITRIFSNFCLGK
ncbi:MAG: 50S ribosome-binding GTPase, partial [Clostridia bacterium]|nr:50S ribosome-binding GTPase [Clostridia bacterium]